MLVYEWGYQVRHLPGALETPLSVHTAQGLIAKLFGNVGGLAIVFGALLMIGNRM